MAGVVHSIDELVGHTPLMELDRFERQQHCGAHILAKLEFFNPTGSVKDRAALAMIQAAEQSGALKPGGTIVEQTSGNTGIGLAAFAAARGYRMEIFLERGASLERRLILQAYGARLLDYKDAIGLRPKQSAATPGRSRSARQPWRKLPPTADARGRISTIRQPTRPTRRHISAQQGRRSGRMPAAMWMCWSAWQAQAVQAAARRGICAAATPGCGSCWCSPIQTPA